MVERLFVFTCDDCKAIESLKNYGLPAGWRALAPSMTNSLKQLCPHCASRYPEQDLLDKNGMSQRVKRL